MKKSVQAKPVLKSTVAVAGYKKLGSAIKLTKNGKAKSTEANRGKS
jgi:hypothetical protein